MKALLAVVAFGTIALLVVAWVHVQRAELRSITESIDGTVKLVGVGPDWEVVRDRSTAGSAKCNRRTNLNCPRYDVLFQTNKEFTRAELIALAPVARLVVDEECTRSPAVGESWIRCIGIGQIKESSVTLISIDAGVGAPNMMHLIVEQIAP